MTERRGLKGILYLRQLQPCHSDPADGLGCPSDAARQQLATASIVISFGHSGEGETQVKQANTARTEDSCRKIAADCTALHDFANA